MVQLGMGSFGPVFSEDHKWGVDPTRLDSPEDLERMGLARLFPLGGESLVDLAKQLMQLVMASDRETAVWERIEEIRLRRIQDGWFELSVVSQDGQQRVIRPSLPKRVDGRLSRGLEL